MNSEHFSKNCFKGTFTELLFGSRHEHSIHKYIAKKHFCIFQLSFVCRRAFFGAIMVKKAKRLIPKKRKSLPKETTGDAAKHPVNEIYEVEKIVGMQSKGNMLYYTVKWKNYPSEDNTNEPEFRLVCDDKILEYLVERFNGSDYLDKIPTSVDMLDQKKNSKDILTEVVEPLSSIGQMTVFGGSAKIVSINAIPSKVKYLKYITSCDQSYILHSLLVPSADEIGNDMKQYQTELNIVQNLFVDYPKMSIKVPVVGNTFYSPPPLSHLIFEPVTLEMFKKREKDKYHFAPKSDQQGFNKVNAFIDPSHLEKIADKTLAPIAKLNRLNFGARPRFDVELKLTQFSARGWSLVLNQEVSENTPLLVMAGIIHPSKEAQKCLNKEGEQVAFSCFINVPGSGMCLDRRQFHDFSKYIPHSCEPTCGVRLVNSGNSVPDLVVYSLQDIDASNSYAITLDYFKMFRDDVEKYFVKNRAPEGQIFHLYGKQKDFVHCQCESTNCNTVVYIKHHSFAKETEPPKKRSRVSSTQDLQEPVFGGLKLVESGKVYTIKDGAFTD